jgi:hypothetical protein
MILKKINFYQNKGKPNYWKIKGVNLEQVNLVVGLNATGKTRLMNVIINLAKIISRKVRILNGHWELEFFNTQKNDVYNYKLDISNKIVKEEKFIKNGKTLLQRTGEEGKIFYNTKNKSLPFAPPKKELTLHVRRDKKEHPFLEELYNWGNKFYGYTFTNAIPNQVALPGSETSEIMLENLGTVPYLLIKALRNPKIKKKINDDLSYIGYPINSISSFRKDVAGVSLGVPVVVVQEEGLKCPTSQIEMSQGMYRALSLIIIIEHILSKNEYCSVGIDDLGEGLDFDRSTKLTKLLFNKVRSGKIQLIVTSNDRFLINATEMKYLNILQRRGHVVTSYNYSNSKERFDEFELSGLNTFDLFSRKMFKDIKK